MKGYMPFLLASIYMEEVPLGKAVMRINLFQHLTVLENIIVGATTVKKVPKEQAIDKAVLRSYIAERHQW